MLVLALALALGAPSWSLAAESLNNDEVIALVKAGLSEAVVIEKIETTPTAFDTSLAGLRALKETQVPLCANTG